MKSLLACALLLLPLPAMAQDADDHGAVVATVDAFMAAFAAKDEEAMTALVTPEAALVAVRANDSGNAVVSSSMANLAATIASIPRAMVEPIAVRAVMVEGPLAMVWADFGLYADGALSHCGVNLFSLVQLDGEWRIAGTTYSHITDSCAGAPTP